MKISELRQVDISELQKKKDSLLMEQFNMRIQKGTGQLAKSHLIKNARRNIARINTILAEKYKEKGK